MILNIEHPTLMRTFFFFLAVLIPRVLFLCTPGFSILLVKFPGFVFRVVQRRPPNNSTA